MRLTKARTLRHSFDKTLRKMALTVSFGFFATTGTFAQTQDIKLNPREVNETNRTLLKNARADFTRLATLGENHYSKQLDSLERVFKKRLPLTEDSLYINNIEFLDPAKFDVATAIGFDKEEIISVLAKLDGVIATDAKEKAQLLDHLTYLYESTFQTFMDTPIPSANWLNYSKYVIPSSDHATVFNHPLKGFSMATTILHCNLHEGYHSIDNRYSVALKKYNLADVRKSTNGREHMQNKAYLGYMSTHCLAESFADIAALGDMIRTGRYDTTLIDAVMDFRQKTAIDAAHHDIPTLKGFKKALTEKGIEKFRAMSDKDALRFYYAVNNTYGMNAQTLYYILKIQNSNPDVNRVLKQQAEQSIYIRTAFDFISSFNKTDTYVLRANKSPQQKQTSPFADWKPMDDLKKLAFETDGKITPESIIKAFAKTQSIFQVNMAQASPVDRDFWIEKTILLRKAFTMTLQDVHFENENIKRGVNPKTLLSQKAGI